jgi:hypothetical protein
MRLSTTILLALSLLSSIASFGCGEGKCVRNSNCNENYMCSAGTCVVVPDSGADDASVDTDAEAGTTGDAGDASVDTDAEAGTTGDAGDTSDAGDAGDADTDTAADAE